MKKNRNGKHFVICIDNSGYSASLELHKIYPILADEHAAKDNFLRVIDESGEGYLYSAKRFVTVRLPERVKRAIESKVQSGAKKNISSSSSDKAALVQRVAGIWKDRQDLPATRRLVRRLRKGSRVQRLKLS